ncbi:unnamed protein product, partial [Larinioides sclopetarius]
RNRKVFHINDSDFQRIRNANLQHSPKKLRKRRNLRNNSIAWIILKIIIFIICVILFFYQSMSFLSDYYSYPSTTRFSVDNPTHFKMPCITLCNINPLRRSKLCNEYPHLCESPNNMTAFCLERPHMCTRNYSDLLIPKFGYFTSEDATDEIYSTLKRDLYDNRNLSQEAWSIWTWDIPTGWGTSNRDIITSLILGTDGINYPTCYSANLRLNNELPPLTWNVEDSKDNIQLENFNIKVQTDEAFRPWYIPQIILAIHSPYVPVQPIQEGEILKLGYLYLVTIKLEEEHLLPYPYQTDCMDYDALWRKNNKTGPRSQEVCRQWCLRINSICDEFHYNVKMIPYNENMCELNSKMPLEANECKKTCKADCKRLKYSYKITEIPLDERHNKAEQSDSIYLRFYLEERHVVIMSHTPVYVAEDIFSYIGGLMGCWLGFSVATFVGSLESTFTVVRPLTKKLRRYFT